MAAHGEHENDTILSLPHDITIRRYRDSDVPDLSKHGNSQRIWDNLRNRMPRPYTEEACKIWIDRCRSEENFQVSGPWTVGKGAQGIPLPTNYCIVVAGSPCGSIGLDFHDPSDIYFRNAEMGYWLSEDHWGKGFMSVVVPAFVDWIWRTFGVLLRLDAEVSANNVGSRRCLEKAGFVEEGRKKWGLVKNGVLRDNIFMGMLRPGSGEQAG